MDGLPTDLRTQSTSDETPPSGGGCSLLVRATGSRLDRARRTLQRRSFRTPPATSADTATAARSPRRCSTPAAPTSWRPPPLAMNSGTSRHKSSSPAGIAGQLPSDNTSHANSTAAGLVAESAGPESPVRETARARSRRARRSPIAGLTRTRAERARYLCSRWRRLPADTAPVRALGSGEGDRAAELGLTIQIVANHSPAPAVPHASSVAVAIARSTSLSRSKRSSPAHRRRPPRRDGDAGTRRARGFCCDRAVPYVERTQSRSRARNSRRVDRVGPGSSMTKVVLDVTSPWTA